jgi:hypothetical protein
MAAKKGPSYQMGTSHRDKIKNSNILNALIEHAEGTRDMKASQVTAGLGLLDRIMPKLAQRPLRAQAQTAKSSSRPYTKPSDPRVSRPLVSAGLSPGACRANA